MHSQSSFIVACAAWLAACRGPSDPPGGVATTTEPSSRAEARSSALASSSSLASSRADSATSARPASAERFGHPNGWTVREKPELTAALPLDRACSIREWYSLEDKGITYHGYGANTPGVLPSELDAWFRDASRKLGYEVKKQAIGWGVVDDLHGFALFLSEYGVTVVTRSSEHLPDAAASLVVDPTVETWPWLSKLHPKSWISISVDRLAKQVISFNAHLRITPEMRAEVEAEGKALGLKHDDRSWYGSHTNAQGERVVISIEITGEGVLDLREDRGEPPSRPECELRIEPAASAKPGDGKPDQSRMTREQEDMLEQMMGGK